MTSALRWGWVVSTTPRPLYPPGKILYSSYRRLRGPQGRSGRVRKISPPQGFDPRTVQPVASRYTDWAIPAKIHYIYVRYRCQTVVYCIVLNCKFPSTTIRSEGTVAFAWSRERATIRPYADVDWLVRFTSNEWRCKVNLSLITAVKSTVTNAVKC